MTPPSPGARSRQFVLTLPNQLTLLRMGLVPVFLVLVLAGRDGWALLTFLLAGLTDALDGFIARVFRQKTVLGAYLDPMADKALLLTALLTLSLHQSLNSLPVFAAVFFLSRDFIVLLVVAVVMLTTPHRDFRPFFLGKATTFFQLFLIVYALFYNWKQTPAPWLAPLLWTTIAVTGLSSIQYSLRITRLFAEQEPGTAPRNSDSAAQPPTPPSTPAA